MKKVLLTEAPTATRRHLRFEYATTKRTKEIERMLVNEVQRYLIQKHPKPKYRVAEIESGTGLVSTHNVDNPPAAPEPKQAGYHDLDITAHSSYNLKNELNIHSPREQHFVRQTASELIRDFFGSHHTKTPGKPFPSDQEATDWGTVIWLCISGNVGAVETPEILTQEDLKNLSADLRSQIAHHVGPHLLGMMVKYGSEKGTKLTHLNPASNLAHNEEYPFYWIVIAMKWASPPVIQYEDNQNIEMAQKFPKLQQKQTMSPAAKQKIEQGYATIVSELLKDTATHGMNVSDMLEQIKAKIEY